MNERRRHRRIRFSKSPRVRVGQAGYTGYCALESLSLGGLMVHSERPLRVGAALGCEFELFASPTVDLSVQVVSRIGERYSARFSPGPVSECLIRNAIDRGLALGDASVLSISDVQGCRVMRVAGGLAGLLRDDFMHALTHQGVDRIDLSEVTRIDGEGVDLCRVAIEQYRVGFVRPSPCVREVMSGPLAAALKEFINKEMHND